MVGAVFACIPLLFSGETGIYSISHILLNEVSHERGRFKIIFMGHDSRI